MDDNNVTISGRNIWHNYPHKMSDNLKSVMWLQIFQPQHSYLKQWLGLDTCKIVMHNGIMARPVIVFITIKKRQTFLISN